MVADSRLPRPALTEKPLRLGMDGGSELPGVLYEFRRVEWISVNSGEEDSSTSKIGLGERV
jgi:hypothetical protein